jgi:hypothetical protein
MGAKAVVAIWVVDALVKVFPFTAPPEQIETTIRIAAARNEFEAGQIAIRADRPIESLRVRSGALRSDDGAQIPADRVHCRFLGFVPVEHNTIETPPEELLFAAPAEVPDILLDDPTIKLPPDRTQPVWITVHVPPDAPAGLYRGTLEVGIDDDTRSVPVELTVYDFAVPDERHLFITNWFTDAHIASGHDVKRFSDAFFDRLAQYAREMAAHRQNVFWLSPTLIKATRETDGSLSFDYALFDRYVQTFLDAGVRDRIEIQAVASRPGGWAGPNIVLHTITATDRATGKNVRLDPDQGLGPMLADLQKHLDTRGWLDRAMIHISDEPSHHNITSYRQAAAFVHKYAPRIKRIEAIETTNFDGALEVWVPKLSHLRHWWPRYDAARRNGAELWFYTCCHPYGLYLNRFHDFALTKVRLLHWLNYRYALDGYLHWGLNFWHGDPFGPPAKRWPPGDSHIVYPGPHGPLPSIRWDAQRDGIEDYEWLRLLEQRHRDVIAKLGPAAAPFDPALRSMELCQQLVHSFLEYDARPGSLRRIRAAIADEIVAAPTEPLVIWKTFPDTRMALAPGPVRIQVVGVTRPGATVQVNGTPVTVAPDGAFDLHVPVKLKSPTITLTVEHDGRKKASRRTFRVLRSRSHAW